MGEQKNVTALEAEADDINPFALPQDLKTKEGITALDNAFGGPAAGPH